MAKRPQVTLEDLKKSLSTLSGEMSEAQLKRANETLLKIEQSVVKENIETAVQEKTLLDVKKSLGKDGDINKNLKEMLKYYKTSNDKLIKKLDELKQVGDVNKVGDIRNEKPMTLKEGLKATVAGVKGTTSSIGRGARALGSGILETLGNPIGAAKKAGKAIMGKAGGLLTTAKDVLATPEEYTIEGGRYTEEYSKAKQQEREAQGGSLMNPATTRKLDAHVGLKNFNDLQKVESKMGAVEDRIKDTKTQGFQPLKKDVQELKSLSEKHSSVDVRNQIKPTEAPVAAAEKANQAVEAAAISEAKALQKENPEADNIKSAQESMADDSKADLEISKQLLETTKESLQELRGIKEALSGGGIEPLRTKPVEGVVAGSEAAVAANDSGGLGIGDALDVLGRGKGPKGGARSIGSKLGGLARGAGSLLSKAAVPLAIAGAGYSAFQGVGKAGENFDLKAGEESTLGQKTSSALGSIASDFTFGMVDEKSAARGIHKAGSAITDIFTGGDKGSAAATVAAGAGSGTMLKPGPDGEMETETQRKRREAKTGTGAYGFPLQSETKPAETIAGKTTTGASGFPLQDKFKPSNKLKVFNEKTNKVEEYNTPEELDKAVKEGKVSDKNALNAKRAFEVETKSKGTAKLEEGQVSAMQPAGMESPDMQLNQDIQAMKNRVAEVTPSRPSTAPSELSKSSLEYTDLEREVSQSKPTPAPIIMNNSSNSATTQVVPMKGDPRPNSRGSALDRYVERTATF